MDIDNKQIEPDIYKAIIKRCSIRRYQGEEIDGDLQSKIMGLKGKIKPLIQENSFDYTIHKVKGRSEDLVELLGGYGRIVDCPQFLLPILRGKKHIHEDLGFRMQQLVIYLTQMGLASCYIASSFREKEVKALFNLDEEDRTTAFILFGYPDDRRKGELFNKYIWKKVGARNKKPLEEIVFDEAFHHPIQVDKLNSKLLKVLEAARNSPSAYNTQPWRFILKGDKFYLAAKKDFHYKKLPEGVGEKFKFYLTDGGIAMGNFSMAYEAEGFEGAWDLIEDDAERNKMAAKLELPQNFHLIGSIGLEDPDFS